jgi:hypothetical protein
MTDDIQVDSKWHFRKEVQLGHLITTVCVVASVAIYVFKLEQRISLMEYQIIQQTARDDRQDKAMAESDTYIRAQLDKIGEKLDRVIERNNLLNGGGPRFGK